MKIIKPSEITIPIASGNVQALSWGKEDSPPILCMHGWLDNANSFYYLASQLSGYHVVAIDLPGHGLSDHRPKGGYFHIIDYIGECLNVADSLGWDKFSFMSHSLGAAVATLIAGVFPDRIQAVGLIDALGPFSTQVEKIPHLIAKSYTGYQKVENKRVPRYNSMEEAITARLRATPMERHSVETLVSRSLKQEGDYYLWRNDKRLMLTPMVMLTEEQIEEFLQRITAPVCLIRPHEGWPFGEDVFQSRTALVKFLEIHRIPGMHHVHMDNPELVGKIFQTFFDKHLALK